MSILTPPIHALTLVKSEKKFSALLFEGGNVPIDGMYNTRISLTGAGLETRQIIASNFKGYFCL